MNKKMRRHARQSAQRKATLIWQDERGTDCHTSGTCIDVSETGVQIELKDPVPMGAYVSFRLERPLFQGTGSVRYCMRSGLKYKVGLQFTGGLRWKGD